MNEFKGTIYDILGYFAPGIFMIFTLLAMYCRVKNYPLTFNECSQIFKSINGLAIFVLCIIAYSLGHAISSISSFLIEKKLVQHISFLKNYIAIKSLLDSTHYNSLCDKYKRIFGMEYNDSNFRMVITYVQSKYSSTYDTALIFLSFYGMARNFALVFFSLMINELYMIIQNLNGSLQLTFIFLIFFIVFIHEYLRFTKYFRETIVSGFLQTIE